MFGQKQAHGRVNERERRAAVLGGMLAATLIAIFIIPVTFYVSQRFKKAQPSRAAPAPVASAAPHGDADS